VKTAPLDELYFGWLYSQVESVEIADPSRTYWEILKQLYSTEFLWIIPNDDNRAEDGKALRHKFISEEVLVQVDQNWLELGCSMLELMIALSERLSFDEDGDLDSWFWELMENLELERYNDNTDIPVDEVNEILLDVIWRTYKRSGRGGLFPLRRAKEDQRDVELWYQLQNYVLERD
jgi:hypothetical protein